MGQQIDKVKSHFEAFSNKGRYIDSNDLGIEWPILAYLKTILNKKRMNLNILEVGCGGGNLLENINIYYPGNNLYGIDITEGLINHAELTCNHNIKFEVGSVTDIKYNNFTFDVVIAVDLLHHLVGLNRDQSKKIMLDALREMKRVLKHDGYFLIREPLIRHKLPSYIYFYASYIYTNIIRINIEMSYLEINKDVIVAFLTKGEYYEMIDELELDEASSKIELWGPMQNPLIRILQMPYACLYFMGTSKKK